MTREEAIKRLKTEIDDYTPFEDKWDGAKEDVEALKMAIKSLAFVDKMHQLKTDYNDYKISQDERIKAEAELFKEMGI